MGAFLACFWLPLRNIDSGILAVALPPYFFYFCPAGHGPAEGITWIWDVLGSALAGSF